MASALNERWKELGRVIRTEMEGSDSPSLIFLERPFVVPGGRFREMYYWDSYWTILGLLKSEMTDTVKGEEAWFGFNLVSIQVNVKQHGKKDQCTCTSYCSHD